MDKDFLAAVEDAITLSETVRNFTSRDEKWAMAQLIYNERPSTVVEIGVLFGSMSIVLGTALQEVGRGTLYCIDTFDPKLGGDWYSRPYYVEAIKAGSINMYDRFFDLLSEADLGYPLVQSKIGLVCNVLLDWRGGPIDIVFDDGDSTRGGARAAWDMFEPLVRPGGFVALHNSLTMQDGNDGHRIVANELMVPPAYGERRVAGTTTIARKTL